ncbi:hypothetical protein L198_02009 [Cryptococcus wingfieldii CBS 7118]|uniref:RING-type domain-containing protein n=1 Tax=Cryptococcus wingfieldii CBS 7118 TaxID=1295528 RepID=A0A1E3JYN1_9TREE|nr:hypothetical protein L198_02009 [Cryptococcus wingfieldii CBS 7118]ODO05317.1 hypothetical protein L198_02009 [Cryptococcus wingfieldii CBS 7118]
MSPSPHMRTTPKEASPPPPYRSTPSPPPASRPLPPNAHVRPLHRRPRSTTPDAHRWLSQDEGRRASRPSPSAQCVNRNVDGNARTGDAGPSTRAHRENLERSFRGHDAVRQEESVAQVQDVSRRRKHGRSVSLTRTPKEDSVDARSRPVKEDQAPEAPSKDTLLSATVDGPTLRVPTPPPGIPCPSTIGTVPDFIDGRGGDGIGASVPSRTTFHAPIVAADEELSGVEAKKALLDKLEGHLQCPDCPQSRRSLLHNPVTLPCGHTLSASHLSFPALPPMAPVQDMHDPDELLAVQQRRHQQKLALWAGVRCTVVECKRYAGATEEQEAHDERPAGVPIFPVPPPFVPPSINAPVDNLPPAYSFIAGPNVPSTLPLLDTRIEKLIHLIQVEEERLKVEEDGGMEVGRVRQDMGDSSGSSSDDEHDASGDEGLPSAPRPPRSTKRCRRRLLPQQRQTGAEDEWQFKKELILNTECDVCAMTLYEPLTTPCQHSFCRKCLSRTLDHSPRCPVCRQDLPSFTFFQDHPSSKTLMSVLTTALPAEYAERRSSIESEEREALLSTPLFVCTLAFPGMPTILHVFEPRYRLMIRRCIEWGSPRFGMVLPARGTGPENLQGVMEYGTMLEIQSVQMLRDGRSIVETVGTHRFRILEKGSLDGYTVGRIERMDDISPEEEEEMERQAVERRAQANRSSTSAPISPSLAPTSLQALPMTHSSSTPRLSMPTPTAPNVLQPPGGGGMDFAALAAQSAANNTPPFHAPSPEDTPESTEELMSICRAFIDQLRSGSAPWLLQRLNNTYGSMPEDKSEFSYWMALVMPIDEYEKARLLPIRSARLRLKLIVYWVESLRGSWW